jgi:2-keto-4-pentenoate hydratase
MSVDPRLVAAVREQLARRPADAPIVGWKYGSGDGERIGDEIAVGHLTTKSVLEDGATYRLGGADLHADVELAVELGPDGASVAYAVALEICDLACDGSPEEVVAANDYHRAVVFAPFVDARPSSPEAALVINGTKRASGQIAADAEERVAAVARVLRAAGEELRPGDRVITGLVVNTPVRPGDDVVAEMGELGSVRLAIA